MSRLHTAIAFLLLGASALNAQFAVKLNSPDELRIVADGTFVQDPSASSGFTFAGIDVADIGEISASALSQDAAGSVVSIPDGISAAKRAAILDLCAATGENEAEKRNFYSCEYMLEVAGIPYFVTTSLQEATENSSMLLLTSSPAAGTFSDEEITVLREYVSAGAILFSPNLSTTVPDALKDLFGISAVSVHSKETRRMLNWVSGDGFPELAYIDEPEEKATALGSINASTLTPSTAVPLAFYKADDTSTAGVVRNTVGRGKTYLFALLWRDVIQRPQLDKDMDTGRGHSNTFEPSADVYPLFIRAAYVAANPATAWKFTVPDGYSAVLVPTHDCDSRTAYDEMHYMSDYEHSLGLRGHYFLTTHYFRQPDYLSAFYCDETLPAIRSLLDAGHTVGSHSICHFPDFGSYKDYALIEHFPMKEYTREEYAEYATHDVKTGVSYGSTWAELVLSKQIIESDFGNNVRSFRSGHLCVNRLMPEAHRIAGYNFSSCYTATNVMSEFPFIQRMQNEWAGEPSGVLQIPLHFSDVFGNAYEGEEKMDETNYEEKAAIWVELFNKLKGNYASSVILIHPNREWKMLAEKILVENLDPADCGLYNFEDYGDFWLARKAFDFETFWIPDEHKMIIRANSADIAANPALAIMVETPAAAAGETPADEISCISLVDETNTVHPARIRRMSAGKYLVIL